VGIGVCNWDDHGRFVLAKTKWYSHILEVDTGEALGFLTDLNWVYHSQLNKMDFELDSKPVVGLIFNFI